MAEEAENENCGCFVLAYTALLGGLMIIMMIVTFLFAPKFEDQKHKTPEKPTLEKLDTGGTNGQ